MARIEHAGAAPETTLAAPIGSGDLSLVADDLSGYPTGAVGAFYIVIDPGTSSTEKILLSSRSGDNATVASGGRGADDTAAVPHLAGAVIQHVFTAIEADEANAHIESDSGVHGVSTEIVGVDDAQTLTNKTISGASNTLSNIPLSAVLFAAGWESALGAILGTNWADAFDTNLGGNWTDAFDTALGAGWPTQLAAAVASGTLLTDTSTATVTNKTLDGDDNTFQDIPQDSVNGYGLRRTRTTSENLGSGVEGRFVDNAAATTWDQAATGTWAGGDAWQWTFPILGQYLVMATLHWDRNSSNQTGPISIHLRRDMSSGSQTSGDVFSHQSQGFPSGTMGSVNQMTMAIVVEPGSTSQLWGLTVHNEGNDTLQRNLFGTHFEIVRVGV